MKQLLEWQASSASFITDLILRSHYGLYGTSETNREVPGNSSCKGYDVPVIEDLIQPWFSV